MFYRKARFTMVKNQKNKEGSQDSKSYPTLNTPKDGRGKYGAKNGAQINWGTQELTEDELNSFRKPNQGDAEETKEENKEELFGTLCSLTLGRQRERSGRNLKRLGRERNRDELQGFHDPLVFKGNCFYRWDGNIQEYPFRCQVEMRGIHMEGRYSLEFRKLFPVTTRMAIHGRPLFFGVQEIVFCDDWNGNDFSKPGHWGMEPLFFGVAEGNGNNSV
jgi:hypothetical protein